MTAVEWSKNFAVNTKYCLVPGHSCVSAVVPFLLASCSRMRCRVPWSGLCWTCGGLGGRYLFCMEFFGEEAVFEGIFSGPFSVIDESFEKVLPACYDAVGLLLMIRITHHHQVRAPRNGSSASRG